MRACALADLDAAMRAVASVLRQRFAAGHASILTWSATRWPSAFADDDLGIDTNRLIDGIARPNGPSGSSVMDELPPLIHDLATAGNTPWEARIRELGGRSLMRLPLHDEQGDLLGLLMLASRQPSAFDDSQLAELRELTAIVAACVRRALLLEQIQVERDLLAHEAELLATMATAESESQVLQAVADSVRSALGADVSVVLALDATRRTGVCSPRMRLAQGDWEAISEALARGGNGRLLQPAGDGCYENFDLEAGTGSPVEAVARDRLHQRSLLIAGGRTDDECRIVIAAGRPEAGGWHPSAMSFLGRIARVLELSLERQRTRSLAIEQGDRLAGQARLLTALDPTRPLEEIARTFAEEIEARFGVECLAILRWAGNGSTDPVLYLNKGLMAPPSGTPPPMPAEYQVVQSGRPEILDLREGVHRRSERILFDAGVRRMARIPITIEGNVAGFVSVGMDDRADAAARVRDLEEAVRPLGLVIERASLLANLEQQRRTLEATAGILATLATAREVGDACDTIAARLQQFFDADHVSISTIDMATRQRTLLGFRSGVLRPDQLTFQFSEAEVELYGAAIRSTSQWFADMDQHNHGVNTLLPRLGGLRSLVRAPFDLADGRAGLITVAAREPNRFGPRDAATLHDLSRAVGMAIDRMNLIRGITETSEMLAAQARVLAALAPGATVEGVGRVFVAEARRLFNAAHAAVAQIFRGEYRLIAVSSDVIDAEAMREDGRTPESDLRIIYNEFMQGKAQIVPDLAVRHVGPFEDRAFRSGLRTMMRVPIRQGDGEVTGIITLASPQANAWGPHHLEQLQQLGAAIGLVAERAELLEAAEERTRKVGHLTRLLSSLHANAAPEEIARAFAAEVRRYLAADAVVIHAFDIETGSGIRVAIDAEGSIAKTARRSPLGPERGDYGAVLEHSTGIFDASSPETSAPWLRATARSLGAGSLIVARLDAEGSPVGMIAAGTQAAGALGDDALHILMEVAAPLAMVLERARVVTTLRQQTQRTQAVLDILAALGPQETLEEVATPVANALRTMFSAEHCTIVVVEGNELVLAGVDSDIVPGWQTGLRNRRTATIDEVTSSGFRVTGDLSDPAEWSSEVNGYLSKRGLRSVMRARIGNGPALGFVAVGSRMPGRFSEADARQLVQIIQPLAVAVSNFHERQELERRSLKLEYTNRILTRLSGGGAPEHLAAGFLGECRVLFGCGHALATYFDSERGAAQLLGIDSDLYRAADVPATLPLGQVHSGRLIERREPEVVHDVREDDQPGLYHPELIAAGMFSVIRAPLIVHERVRGAVSLWGYGTNAFTWEDADLLGTLTRPLAIALEKAAALASLGESELKYRSLVAQAEEMIFLFDTVTHEILDANAYTSRLLGYAPGELLGRRLDDIVDAPADEIAQLVRRVVDDGELHLADRRYRTNEGRLVDVDDVSSLVSYGGRQAVLVLARDVSERKALQRQLVQSQKMESLGAMAGNVAHDFNNLLTTILGFAGLLKRSRSFDSEERENLALIEDAARRAADLTGRLLAFARGGLVRFGPVDLRNVVTDTVRLAEPGMQASLVMTTSLPDAPVMVEGDAGQLQSALLNIVLNARDAMPDGGKLDVTLRSDGVVATLSVADNGPGMDEETRTRIFEPFFTTKPVGSGTGLGMAITYGIIQGHHGDVAVESTRGVGTTFTLTLPVVPGTCNSGGADFNAGEGNLVLIVDDDEMVRRTTSATLAELGYNVVEAPGGATAVEVVRARPDRFSAVLLDLVMPGMTGSETFRALTAIRPDLPVVVCTGYAADAHIDTDVKRRIAGLVQKPFTAERLGRALAAAGARPTRE